MSYCVNCGVELDASAKSCPLCRTPVLNPNEFGRLAEAQMPFPAQKAQVEPVKRKDLGILLSMITLATAAMCGILNALVFQENAWSLTVLGACVVLWVLLEPIILFTRQSVYLSLLYDGLAVVFLLYMITFLSSEDGWFLGLGVPLTVLLTVVAEIFTLCVRKLPRSFLTVLLYFFTAAGLLCMGIELLVNRYRDYGISLTWSAVVLTVCSVFDIALITMLSRRRLRDSVRRRLHF
ncbi:MAG: zinc ribbon domain-containing protein [Acetatifactor sp.]|nr:zinc ribbon domain-containing protein [Acetatifactor sp.]